ncbi:MAG: glycosyltransferase family 4 protein, partial [Aquihabitans sp.]
LAAGWAAPYYTVLIVDPGRSLPLAQLYLTVGFVAMALASRVPLLAKGAAVVDRRAPHLGLEQRSLGRALCLVHVVGLAAVYWSFRAGYTGYQGEVSGRLGAVPVYLATMTIAARVAMAMAWVRCRSPRPRSLRWAAVLSVGLVPIEMVLAGNRGAALTAGIAYAFGAIAGGWRPSPSRLAAVLVTAVLLISVALSFGTTFRELKAVDGQPTKVSTGQQLGFAVDAAGRTIRRGPRVVSDGVDRLSERLEAVGQVAVVVSQYADKRDEERAAGLDDSVRHAVVAGLFPRAVFASKPEPPDTQAIGRVYFEFGGNSFAATPMTDLLRNYGPMGVVAGMAALGLALGLLGAIRRCRPNGLATAVIVGTVLIRGVSYEGFYGTIPSEMIRVGGVAVLTALLLRVASASSVAAPDRSSEPTGRCVTLVSVDLSQRGGLQSVVRFLRLAMMRDGWTVRIVSLATSSTDRNSFVLRRPGQWRPPTVSDESFDGIPYRHVGCWLADLAPFRSGVRRVLTEELAGGDAIVVATGTPFWGLVVPPELHDRLIMEFATILDEESPVLRAAGKSARGAFTAIWRPIMNRQDRRAASMAEAIIVPTAEMARWAVGAGADDVTVVPHAVDPVFQPPLTRTHDGAVVAVGRWDDPRKNLALLVGAAAKTSGLSKLYLIGTLPTPAQLASPDVAGPMAELGPRVRFLGEVSQAVLVAGLRAASFMVLASNQEGFGLPVIEAMACGCPVVTTRSGGVNQSLVDGVDALLVPVRDEEALAAAMSRMIADPELRARLSRGGSEAVRRYSLDEVGPEVVRVVERVARTATARKCSTRLSA